MRFWGRKKKGIFFFDKFMCVCEFDDVEYWYTSVSRSEDEMEEIVGDDGGGTNSAAGSSIVLCCVDLWCV